MYMHVTIDTPWLHTPLPLPPQSNRLLIIGTTSLSDDVLRQLGIMDAFTLTAAVPHLTRGSDVVAVLKVSRGGGGGGDTAITLLLLLLRSRRHLRLLTCPDWKKS